MTQARFLEPHMAAKARVEDLKNQVRQLQGKIAEAGALAKGTWPRRRSLFDEYDRLKKQLPPLVAKLGEAKRELSELSGTDGGDPKWKLAVRAWRVLNELEEAGVEIGEKGRALLDDIEFHVPLAKLHEPETEDT